MSDAMIETAPENPTISAQKLCAALEVFGRETQLIEAELTYILLGKMKPKTVGDLITILDFFSKNFPPDFYLINDLAICTFYDADKKLKAISVTDDITDIEYVYLDTKQVPARLEIAGYAESEYTPDPNYIYIRFEDSNEIEVSEESLRRNLFTGESIKTEQLHTEFMKSLFDMAELAYLPSRSDRAALVDDVRKAINAPAPQ